MTVRRTGIQWRLLLVPPRSGAENMARDVALLDRARHSDEAVFSIYEWSRPTLSLGRNQAARDQYDRDAIRAAGIDVVRRPTGGRALLHHHEVTYSVAAPTGDASLRKSYDRINRILVHGLALLGIEARVATDGVTAPPGTVPCFADPAPGELLAAGRKLVGSAQWRADGALLQHGSILVEDDQSLIAPLMIDRIADTFRASAATLSALLGRRPAASEVASALFSSVRELEDEFADSLDEAEIRTDALERAREFENELWTWRR
jgi:lipoate-protein ligase A